MDGPPCDVFRILTGARAGNVDYLGVIVADSQDGALDMARLMFDHGGGEYLEVEAAEHTVN